MDDGATMATVGLVLGGLLTFFGEESENTTLTYWGYIIGAPSSFVFIFKLFTLAFTQ